MVWIISLVRNFPCRRQKPRFARAGEATDAYAAGEKLDAAKTSQLQGVRLETITRADTTISCEQGNLLPEPNGELATLQITYVPLPAFQKVTRRNDIYGQLTDVFDAISISMAITPRGPVRYSA